MDALHFKTIQCGNYIEMNFDGHRQAYAYVHPYVHVNGPIYFMGVW